VDFVAAGVVSTFGAGLFTGLAPAAALAGPWLLAALVAGGGLGYLTVLSGWERPLDTVPAAVRRVVSGVGVLGRLAAAVAIAGTFGRYVVPAGERFGAVALVVVVTAVAVVVPRVPVLVVRAAAVVVLAALALVVLACFAIEPVSPAVVVEQGGSVLGVVASAGLLTVCFLGAAPPGRGARVVDVRLPDSPWVAGGAGGGAGPRSEVAGGDGGGLGPRSEVEDADGGGLGPRPEVAGEVAADDRTDFGVESSSGWSAGSGRDSGAGAALGSGSGSGWSPGSEPCSCSGWSPGFEPSSGSGSELGGGERAGRGREPESGDVSVPSGGAGSVEGDGSLTGARGGPRTWRLGVLAVVAVVLVVCLAVGAAVLRQLGAPRLALSPVPLLDALAAADAAALEPLVLAGVAVGTGFALLGVIRAVVGSVVGVPPVRVAVAVGGVVAVGAVVVEPTVALWVAAVLLLGDAALRLVAVRHRRPG